MQNSNNTDVYKAKFEKFYHMYFVLTKWMTVNQNNRPVTDYLKRNNYRKIAIYGLKELGILLYDEIVKAGLAVEFIIDKNADYMNVDVETPLYTPDDSLPEADVIIVTAVHYYEEIEKELKEKVNCPIISLEEVIRLS